LRRPKVTAGESNNPGLHFCKIHEVISQQMLSAARQSEFTKGYSCRKRKISTIEKWTYVEDPQNPGKMLRFPKRLSTFLEWQPKPNENNYANHTDRFTNFQWKYRLQNTSPGNYCIDRGNTMVAFTSVPLVDQVLAVSEVGVCVEKEYRSMLAKLLHFTFGPYAFSRFDPSMIINARGIDDFGNIETFNVKLKTMSRAVLATKLQIDEEAIPDGSYVVVVNVLPINIGDELIVENYGSNTKLPYGEPHYLDAQLKCYKAFEEAKKNKPIGRKVCKKCLKLLPKPKHLHHTKHNMDCEPYIWNFIPPTEK
jgi:hypothetical protein